MFEGTAVQPAAARTINATASSNCLSIAGVLKDESEFAFDSYIDPSQLSCSLSTASIGCPRQRQHEPAMSRYASGQAKSMTTSVNIALRAMNPSLGHLLQQFAETARALAHVKPLLHRPHPGRHGMHYRNLEIFFKQANDIEATPTRPQHINTVGVWMF